MKNRVKFEMYKKSARDLNGYFDVAGVLHRPFQYGRDLKSFADIRGLNADLLGDYMACFINDKELEKRVDELESE